MPVGVCSRSLSEVAAEVTRLILPKISGVIMLPENLQLCWRTHGVRRFREFPLSQREMAGLREGRISILTPDLGRSPSAACRPAEADCRKSVILCLAMRCEPGLFAVRRGQYRDAPVRESRVEFQTSRKSRRASASPRPS